MALPSYLETTAVLIRLAVPEIGRQYRHLRVLDKTAKLRGYPVSIRQLAVTDLGHERPTPLLANQIQAKAADLIDRFVRRMVIVNGSADSIDFLPMDALSSEVPLRIDADPQCTTMAGTPYWPLARRIAGLKVAAKSLGYQVVPQEPAPA